MQNFQENIKEHNKARQQNFMAIQQRFYNINYLKHVSNHIKQQHFTFARIDEGPVFDLIVLGLCDFQERQLQSFQFDGLTHNYEREHKYKGPVTLIQTAFNRNHETERRIEVIKCYLKQLKEKYQKCAFNIIEANPKKGNESIQFLAHETFKHQIYKVMQQVE